MQLRMDAGLRKYTGDSVKIINYAPYIATVCEGESGLTYAEEIHGMWDVDRYIHLLMGEIPRLTDNAGGYGPTGKQFIAHVDIPDNVQSAFDLLRTQYGRQMREADPMFASD